MRRALVPIAAAVALAAVAGACGSSSDDDAGASTATTAPATTAADGPAIAAFRVPTEVACSGQQAQVPVTWTTERADGVSFSVDGAPVPAGAGYDASGAGNIPVPCDDARHEITITAGGEAAEVSESAEVGTVIRPVPRQRPAITRLSAPATEACTGSTVEVPLIWATRAADSVAVEVDGSPLSADAGRALSGSTAVPVPCDDATHTITLTAFGAGTAAASHSVEVRTVPRPPAGTPVIEALTAPAEVSCTGSQTAVTVRWATRDAEAVSFSVDGQPVPAGAGYPPSGSGNVPVPCDDGEHTVTLDATGDGGDDVSHSVTVHAVPKTAPVARPAITRVTSPTRVGCTPGQDSVVAPVTWRTRNAHDVLLTLDGQEVGDSGLPPNGGATVTVPCDGQRHFLKVIAQTSGTSEAQVRRPITAVAGGGSTAPVPTSTAPVPTAP